MPKALWTTRLDGDAFRGALIVRDERIFVSTDRGTSALDREGSVLWDAPGVVLRSVRDDGHRIAVWDSGWLTVLDEDGRTIRKEPLPGAFAVVGWTSNGNPVLAVEGDHRRKSGSDLVRLPLGCAWVEPFGYMVTEGCLWRFNADGHLQSRESMALHSFQSQLSTGHPLYDDIVVRQVLQGPFDLTPDERHARLIAWRWSVPALVMSIDFKGVVRWFRSVGRNCCNSVCPPARGDTVWHLSSCGSRLTCLDGDGRSLVVRDLEMEPNITFRSGVEVAVVFGGGSVSGFDLGGARQWTCDVPRVWTAAARDEVLYTLSANQESGIDVSAFDLRT